MKLDKTQIDSVINPPKQVYGYKLYPATYGIVEWLKTTRNNQAINQEREVELKDIGELCFAFTKSADEITSMTEKQLEHELRKFMNGLLPDAFHALQKHAETELLKFVQTKSVPKKKALPYPPIQSRKKRTR